MKRLLSAILTLALVLSLIPAVFAGDTAEKQVYRFAASDDFPAGRIFDVDKSGDEKYEPYKNEINGVQYYVRADILNYTTNRNWKLYDAPDTLVEAAGKVTSSWFAVSSDNCLKIECASSYLNHYGDFSLSLRGEQTGFYIPHMSVKSTNASQNIGICLFFENDSIGNYDAYRGDDENCFVYALKIPTEETQFDGTKAIYTENGKDMLAVFTTTNKRRPSVYDITFTEIQNPKITIIVDKTELDITENTSAVASTTVKGDNQTTAIPIGEDFVEYKSSDENVAKVSANGEITAVGGGKAKIYAQSPDGLVKSNEVEITVTAPSTEDEALTNAFEVKKEELTEYVAPSVVSVSAGGSVITPEKNSDGSYDIEAAEENTDGAKFLYWAKGLKANKKIVSFSNKLENYIPEEDGADWLIAVYEDKLPATNEYYNANGQLLATGAEPALPSMAGYGKANDWKQYGETNIYVAEYSGKTQPDDVEVTVNGEKKTVPYGTEITCTATAENFKCWTKSNINGNTEIVSAEKVYKFKAWENCEVNAVNEAHTYTGDKFKIVVDRFTVGNETGIMAEFIGFGSNVVEKGIMWGSNKIAMTKPGCQFSVIADKNGEYKGYAIVGTQTDGYTLITDGSVTVSDAE